MSSLIDKIFHILKIENKKEQKAFVIQFFKFGLVGLSNTFVSWAVYYLFLLIDENLYMIGSVVGTIVSIANAFFWNNKFVFKSDKKDWKHVLQRLGKTYISYGGTSLLSIGLVWLEVNLFKVNKVFAPILSLIITIPLNFFLNKLWTFKKE